MFDIKLRCIVFRVETNMSIAVFKIRQNATCLLTHVVKLFVNEHQFAFGLCPLGQIGWNFRICIYFECALSGEGCL